MALPAWRAMVRKDILLFFNDRRAVIMSFAAPSPSRRSSASSSRATEPRAARVPVRVVDQDQSSISKAIVHGLVRGQDPRGGRAPSTSRASGAQGKTTVAVVLPPAVRRSGRAGLSSAAPRNRSSSFLRPSHAMELAMVRGILTST
jgi:ABC-2 type transport system permease protein